MKKNYLKLAILLFLGVIISIQSCKKDEEVEEQVTPTIDNKIHANGFVQKGPFVSGSQITIQELDNSLTPTGTTYQTVTNDDFGSFELNSTINTNYLEVICAGFYFNEITGDLSDANLSLRALCEVTDTAKINVNILTTLSKGRIEYLIKENNLSYAEASQQAETEILSIFNINISNLLPFNHMDISQTGESNAILLAISVILQNGNSVAELSELISKISLDIKEDGVISDQNIAQTILNNSKIVNFSQIRKNIENRYTSLGLTVEIPKFEDYIDSDTDGILNKDDDDQYIMGNALQTCPWSLDYNSNGNIISFNNKLWKIDNDMQNSGIWSSSDGLNWNFVGNGPWDPISGSTVVYNNKIWLIAVDNVWNSSDGISWNQVNNNTPFGNTNNIHNTCQVFNNKIYLIADDIHYKVYSTIDGITWEIVNNEALWEYRVNASTYVLNNKLWLAGGGLEIITGGAQNDIWSSSDGITWVKSTSTIPLDHGFGGNYELLNGLLFNISESGILKSENGEDFYWFVDATGENYFLYNYVSCQFDNKIFIYANNSLISYIEKYSDYSNNL